MVSRNQFAPTLIPTQEGTPKIEYPGFRYHAPYPSTPPDKEYEKRLVNSPEEEAALGPGWVKSPVLIKAHDEPAKDLSRTGHSYDPDMAAAVEMPVPDDDIPMSRPVSPRRRQ